MIVGIPKETAAGERRVALVPELVGKLTGAGLEGSEGHCTTLVVKGNLPQRLFHVGGIRLAPVDQLAHSISIRPGRQGPAARLQQGPHVHGHRGQVERGLHEGVIEVEGAHTEHALTVPWTC